VRKIRVYVDTSVFGGVYDPEFAGPSQEFFDRVREGRHVVLVSSAVYDELQLAPENVRKLLEDLPPHAVEDVPMDVQVRQLAEAYIASGVVNNARRNDARHVAAETIARADLILSWNFRHIVNFDRIRKFNGINLLNGYTHIEIHSPLELLGYGDED
jgi:hypothetical protein